MVRRGDDLKRKQENSLKNTNILKRVYVDSYYMKGYLLVLSLQYSIYSTCSPPQEQIHDICKILLNTTFMKIVAEGRLNIQVLRIKFTNCQQPVVSH